MSDSYTTIQQQAIMFDPIVKIPNPNTNGGYYQQISLSYNQGDFIFEGCPMFSPSGLARKGSVCGVTEWVADSGADSDASYEVGYGTEYEVKTHFTIFCKFDPTVKSQQDFIDTMTTIYHKCATVIETHKYELLMKAFSAKDPIRTGFKFPLHVKCDYKTGEILPGRGHIIFWELNDDTTFYDKNDRVVPRHELEYKEMTFIPTIHIKSIYIDGYSNTMLKMSIVSAKILEMYPCNSVSKQLGYKSELIVSYQKYNNDHLIAEPNDLPTLDLFRIGYKSHTIRLSYNYGTEETLRYDIFLVDGTEMDTTWIQDKKIRCELDPSGQFVETMRKIFNHCKHILIRNKNVTGSGAILEDPVKNNCITLSISQDRYMSTLFTDSKGDIISRDHLINKKFKCIPLIHIKRIDLGLDHTVLNMHLHSAIVTHME